MYATKEARELAVLLGISQNVDIFGDVSATVDSPSELLAFATILDDPEITAWTGTDPGRGYVQVAADRNSPPVRGRVTAVLPCAQHAEFWDALGRRLDPIEPRTSRRATLDDLAAAWSAIPLTPPEEPAPDDDRPAPGEGLVSDAHQGT